MNMLLVEDILPIFGCNFTKSQAILPKLFVGSAKNIKKKHEPKHVFDKIA